MIRVALLILAALSLSACGYRPSKLYLPDDKPTAKVEAPATDAPPQDPSKEEPKKKDE